MPDFNIILPSKPRIVSETDFAGVYEIEGLYPGYGHTLGNSLRRIILSSLPGFAITSLKIDGVSHEFSTISGIKEDVINIILNLKKVRFAVVGDDPQVVHLSVKNEAPKEITAKDLDLPGQVTALNPEQLIATITNKNATLEAELTLEKGLGYVPSEILKKGKVEVGNIALDAVFTPIRRASYEVEDMRVGDRTDFNKLIIKLETDGTISPRQALEQGITTMINQLKAVVGFKEEELVETDSSDIKNEEVIEKGEDDALKTKIDDLDLSVRVQKALTNAGIRTLSGLSRKKEADLKNTEGLGEKGLQEIKKVLEEYGVSKI